NTRSKRDWSSDVCSSDLSKLSKRDRDVFENLLNKNGDMACPRIWQKFAHALTVHKSQGSEWNKVVYVVQASDMKINSGTNLPYSAITMAKNNIVIGYVVGQVGSHSSVYDRPCGILLHKHSTFFVDT